VPKCARRGLHRAGAFHYFGDRMSLLPRVNLTLIVCLRAR